MLRRRWEWSVSGSALCTEVVSGRGGEPALWAGLEASVQVYGGTEVVGVHQHDGIRLLKICTPRTCLGSARDI